jgi:hypothetical protein
VSKNPSIFFAELKVHRHVSSHTALYYISFISKLNQIYASTCLVADTPPEVSFVAVESLCATGEGPSCAPQQNIYYKTVGSVTVSSLSPSPQIKTFSLDIF